MRGANKRNLVMIADDDLFVRKIIRSALEDLADIEEVIDGEKVLEKYKARMPDLIFLDIHLPNVMGDELIRPLLHIDKGAHIIMLSADSSETNVRNARLRGSRGFMTKPFSKERVIHYFNTCPTIKFAD